MDENQVERICNLLKWIILFLILLTFTMCGVGARVAMACDEEPEYIVPDNLFEYVEPDSEYANTLIPAVNNAAAEYEIDVLWLWATFFIESRYQHYDTRGRVKRGASGERGIGQIIPDAMTIKKRHDLHDVVGNVECAAELLAFALQERTDGDMWRASGWYNTGKIVLNHYAREVRKEYTRQTANTPRIPHNTPE